MIVITFRNVEKPTTGWAPQTINFIQSYVRDCGVNENCIFLTVDEMTGMPSQFEM